MFHSPHKISASLMSRDRVKGFFFLFLCSLRALFRRDATFVASYLKTFSLVVVRGIGIMKGFFFFDIQGCDTEPSVRGSANGTSALSSYRTIFIERDRDYKCGTVRCGTVPGWRMWSRLARCCRFPKGGKRKPNALRSFFF